MIAPIRLQLSRAKGFNLQEVSQATNGLTAVNVARPSKWGNPFKVGKPCAYSGGRPVQDNRHAARLYQAVAPDNEGLVKAAQTELRGKNLACWCKVTPFDQWLCHADVLLEIANRPVCEEVKS
jgi:hypothetical protein